jgi:hypothetical protein
VLYTGPAEVRLGFHPVESLGCLAQTDALSPLHPPLKFLIRKVSIDFSPEFLIRIRIQLGQRIRIQSGQNCPSKEENMKKQFLTNFVIQILVCFRIRIQQQPGSGSGFSKTPGTDLDSVIRIRNGAFHIYENGRVTELFPSRIRF